jgi:fructan beta-fructosidase
VDSARRLIELFHPGALDGESFTPESPELHYAEGTNTHGDDALYAAQSFAEMPHGRRVQMARGRIQPEGMPFNQMMLFPTEFKMVNTNGGLRLRATPIGEIEKLRRKAGTWSSGTAVEANRAFDKAGPGALDVKLKVTLEKDDDLVIRYQGKTIATVHSTNFESGLGAVEILIDKAVAEIFVDGEARYIVREIPATTSSHGLELGFGRSTSVVNRLEIYPMNSIWKARQASHKQKVRP